MNDDPVNKIDYEQPLKVRGGFLSCHCVYDQLPLKNWKLIKNTWSITIQILILGCHSHK